MSNPSGYPEHNEYASFVGTRAFDALPLKDWPQQLTPDENTLPLHLVASDGMLLDSPLPQYRLGEPDLPVATYRDHVVRTVRENQAVVISSETGSGKSSQLGLYLVEAGFPRVFITQPRILAARELNDRARQNLGQDYQYLAGYKTGHASDSDCGPDACIIYITEQQLFKMANRGSLRPDDTVVLDEAHERTDSAVVLLGLMKDLLRENPAMRLVISSATIDTDRFARYLTDLQTGEPAPTLILPGRTYPVTNRESLETVADTMRKYMEGGHNVLAFEPGVRRMRETQRTAQKRQSEDVVHLLYGDQSPSDQRAALNPEDCNHIVATRIGETSITPQGKDVVIDSRLSNNATYRAGVQGLETTLASRATMEQRRGRVGRTKPGTYVTAFPEEVPPALLNTENPPEYDPPVIQNTSVASHLAELLATGRRLEDLDLIDQPTWENLQHDYRILLRLGATALGSEGRPVLTDIGRAMIDLPLDVSLARMLVEARTIEGSDELERDDLRLQVAAAAAVQQVRGILNFGDDSGRRFLRRKSHQEPFSREQTSDMLFELDVLISLWQGQQKIMAEGREDAEEQFESLLARNDIKANRYFKALRTLEELCRRENLPLEKLQKPNAEQRKLIISCQITGADEVFVQRSKLTHQDIRGNHNRTLGNRSTIVPALAHLVIGTAFDLSGLRKNGRFLRRFIVGGSVVTLDQLRRYAPHRLSEQSLGHGTLPNGTFVERKAYYFDGELQVGSANEVPSPTLETRVALIHAMMTGTAPNAQNPQQSLPFHTGTPHAAAAVQRWREAFGLEHKSPTKLNVVPRYESLINKTVRESLKTIPLDVTDPEVLDTIIPSVYKTALVRPTRRKDIPDILRCSPDAMTIHIDEDTKQYLSVTYRSGIAYVTIPRDRKFIVKREDFAELAEHHDVKVRVATDKYQQLDALFELIDEQRPAEVAKQERKAEYNAHEAVAEAEGRGKVSRKKDRDADEQRRRAEVARILGTVMTFARPRGKRHLQILETGA